MQRLRVLSVLGVLGVLYGAAAFATAPATPPPTQEASLAVTTRILPGNKITALKLRAIQPGSKAVQSLDLASVIGSKPLVVCYLKLGETAGEEGLLSLQTFLRGPLEGKVTLLGVANPGSKLSDAAVADRLSLLGVTAPFALDDGLELGRALGVTSAPSISLIDATGVLRVPDAKSLKQEVASGISLGDAIGKASRREPVPTVARLGRYYPAVELIGEPYPDFILKKFESGERFKMSETVARDAKEKKIPVLFFWHPNCVHCKKSMPSIMVGYKAYGKWLDLISIVDLKNSDEVRNAQDTIRAHAVSFPVLRDEDRRISDLYKVVSTPTFVFLKPDGTIDSVYTSGDVNYVTVFQARIKSILKVGQVGK